jgi:hypothetical protein
MALISDGSFIIGYDKRSLSSTIDDAITLPVGDESFIFCGAVNLISIGTYRNLSGHTMAWYWREVGGTFAPVTSTGEVKFGTGTSLTDLATVSDEFTLGSPTRSFQLHEFEGSSSAVIPGELINNVGAGDPQTAESQIALNIRDAPPGKQYEMMARCVWSDGTTDIVYPAKFIIPERPLVISTIPYAPTRLGDPYYGDPG